MSNKVRTADVTRRNMYDRKARDLLDHEVKGGGVWDIPGGAPARDVRLDQVRLLPGRVLIRVLPEVHSSTILFVSVSRTDKNSVGRGVVVAMGPAAVNKRGKVVLPQFKVGDTVLFAGQHKSRAVEIEETLHAVAQEEVQAVLE